MSPRNSLATLAFAACFGAAALASAGEPAAKAKPTKEQAALAGQKFREGELTFARHDYPRAAKLFEEAYAIAPHPDALLNAIDARERAGDLVLSARMCERLRKDYPNDAHANEEVAQRIARLTPKLGRLEIAAAAGVTDVKVDGESVAPASIWWVDPGDHAVAARAGAEAIQRSINVVAGAKQNVALAPPSADDKAPKTAPPPPPPADEKPLGPALFFVGLGLTAVAGGVLTWSGIDTESAYDDYAAAPTQDALDDGRGRQLRTNILIGVTAGLGAATAAIGIFATEWGGGSASETAFRLELTASSASLSGSFQ